MGLLGVLPPAAETPSAMVTPLTAAPYAPPCSAAGFGPLTFLLPITLYLIQNGKGMPGWKWWANVGLATAMGLAVLAAAVGSLYQIIHNASNYQASTRWRRRGGARRQPAGAQASERSRGARRRAHILLPPLLPPLVQFYS